MAENMQIVLYGLFTAEELDDFRGITVINDPHFIVIECGCTSNKYGDTIGNLKIWKNGHLEVSCQCGGPECNREEEEIWIPVSEFVKHSRKQGTKWRNEIWVLNREGEKVKLYKTILFKYHKQPFYSSSRELPIHADEFMKCTRCKKRRRFSQRTTQGCRAYHDAQNNPNWTCFDIEKPCDDQEERASRVSVRGCPRQVTCKTCPRCVCVGCNICRFQDCNCSICVEYWRNQI